MASKTSTGTKAKKKTTRSAIVAHAGDARKKLRAEYEELLAVMHASLVNEMNGWDAFWEAVGAIIERKLFLIDGYATGPAWMSDHLHETPRTVKRNVRVARSASPEEETKYGTTKIDLVLALLDAQDAANAKKKGVPWRPDGEPRKVDYASLHFDVSRGGKKTRVNLEHVSTDELSALVRTAGGGRRQTKPTLGAVGQAIVAALAARAGLEEIRVHEYDGMIQVGRFRADQTSEVGHALAGVRADGAVDTGKKGKAR